MHRKTLYQTLAALFAVSLAIANVTAAKLVMFDLPLVGGVVMPAGFLGIAVAFLCSDLLAEFYGRDATKRVVNGTLVALVVAYLLVYAAIAMPAAPFYDLGAEYAAILGAGAFVVAASVVTLTVSQHLDIHVFHALRARTGRRHKWARNVGSTATSQLVDTALFISLAFYAFPLLAGQTPQTLSVIAALIFGQYVVKVLIALADTPAFYLVTFVVERMGDPESCLSAGCDSRPVEGLVCCTDHYERVRDDE